MGRRNRRTRRRQRQRRSSSTRRRYTRQKGGAPAASTAPAVTFVLTNGAGFFSTFFFLCNAFFVAKDTGAPFQIAHDNWQYTAEKGWHDYFTSLNVVDAQEAQGPHRYQHGQTIGQNAYPASRYEAAIAEIYRPKQEYLDKAAAFIKTMGSPTSYTALYVRRGDKTTGQFKEMDLIPLSGILEQAGIKDDGRTLFIQTDDYAVVEEARGVLPSCKIFTMAKESERGAVHGNIKSMNPQERKMHMEQILVGNAVFAGATEGWADGRSNMGRFLKLASFDKVNVYPKTDLTRDRLIKPFSRF